MVFFFELNLAKFRKSKLKINFADLYQGDVSEWFKEQAWKVCIRETVSRVRISQSPQKNAKGQPQGWPFCFVRSKGKPVFLSESAKQKATVIGSGLCMVTLGGI